MFAESLIESALSAGIIEILKDYLVKFCTDEDVTLMVLLAVGSLADSGNYLTCQFDTSAATSMTTRTIFFFVFFLPNIFCVRCTFCDSVS